MSLCSIVALLALMIALANSASPQRCKCAPQDPCWPSPDLWNDLNHTVFGQLIETEPLAVSCYPGPLYDSSACATVDAQWRNATFQANSPVGLSFPLNITCPPVNASVGESPDSCTIGTNPLYAVNATAIDHVSAAIVFAKQHDLRLVVKTTGHDLLGRSDGYGSLEIWLRHLRDGITFHNSFDAASRCQELNWFGPAITIGGGYTWKDVYAIAKSRDVVVVGGGTPSVSSIGGWMQGGGHGPASRQFGLGADQVLEAKVVLADGSIRTVNSCQNQDLFLAIRGGGPGTYGVVVSTIVKAWPIVNATVQHLAIGSLTTDPAPLLDAITTLYSRFPDLNDAGYAGYGTWSISNPAPLFANFTAGYVHVIYMFNETEQYIKDNFATTLEQLLRYNMSSLFISLSYLTYSEYWNFYDAESGVEPPVGSANGAVGSRLLDRQALQDVTALRRTIGVLAGTTEEKTVNSLELVSGGQVFRDANDPYSGINPAWRKSHLSNIVSRSWSDEVDDETVQSIRNDITFNKVAAMKAVAPDTGAYMNEADRLDPDYEIDFYGAEYETLWAIKQKYDPEDVFYCPTCIGSREWLVDTSGKLCQRPY